MDSEYSKITFQHLQYFVKIAELGKMSKAAEELFVTQPLLSQKMHQLETALGVELFLRYRQRLILTDAGEQFLKDCREILQTTEYKLAKLKTSYGNQNQSFTIGFSSGQNRSVVNQIVRSIRETFPDFEFHVQVENLSKTQRNMLCGETDFAFFAADSRKPNFEGVSWRVVNERSVCYVMSRVLFETMGADFSWAELQKYPFIISQNRKNEAFEIDILDLAQRKEVPLRIKYMDADLISLHNYVTVNDCYTVSLQQRPDREDLVYFPLTEIEPYPFIFAWSPLIEEKFPSLIEYMYQCAKEAVSEDI